MEKECGFCGNSNYISVGVKEIDFDADGKSYTDNKYWLDYKGNRKVKLSFQRSFDYEPWTLGEGKFNFCPICGRKFSEV